MTAVLGDFLRPARAHITAAARSGGNLSLPARRAVITELDRLVTTMTRYLDDLVLPDDFTPASTADAEVRAALDGRRALRRAAASLHPAAAAVREAGADDTHPAAGYLSSANSYLAAGRDLLQTHFTTGTTGHPEGSTWWAPVITSPPVTAALLAELRACSRQLGAWTAQLSRTGSLHAGLPATASQGLRAASRWLRTAANSGHPAHRLDPPAAGRRLLLGIPAGFPPPRQQPSNAELGAAVKASGTSLTGIFGVGPVIAGIVVGDVAEVSRFPGRDHFAAYNGTAPVEVSSGNRKVHRLSLRGNRRINHAIHMAAITQIRHRHSKGRSYYEKKLAEGKTHKEALRSLKRQISDAIFARLQAEPARQPPT
jgi:hypothetical protein